jgi:RNA polymerase sigma-70 factor (ECF subfamily)
MLTPAHDARPPDPPSEPSDEALVARIRGGEQSGYEILMRRYNRRLFRVTRSILRDADEAQDAMQEAWLRAFTHLDSFRAPGNFAAWLTRIAINEALMKKRKDQHYAPAAAAPETEDDDSTTETPVLATTPEDLAAGGELRQLIEAAVDRLPDGFRVVFVLRAIEQLSVEETAACLDIPVPTVKTRFHRARGLMQEALYGHIQAVGLSAFDFAGARCDRMVATVLERVRSGTAGV